MPDKLIEQIVGRKEQRTIPLDSLMPRRVRDILLVSSSYDSYTLEEDGSLSEILFSEYIELNLRYAPRIERTSTAEEALSKLKGGRYDMVISMPRIGDMDIVEFCQAVDEITQNIPIALLAYNTREVPVLESMVGLPPSARIFVWHGDVRLFLAIIKSVEDRWNAWHDAVTAGVQSIILIEDSPRFYSSYLPMLYTELVLQTQALMADGLNRTQKLVRMRARPKILLATSYEEGLEYYNRHRDNVLGVIADAGCPRDGCLDPAAGIEFVKAVREDTPDRAVLIQSSEQSNDKLAKSVGAHFINKNSPSLLRDVQEFMRANWGFGDFIFRNPDGSVVCRAADFRELVDALEEIPEESLFYHAGRNDFSSWLMARTEFDLAKAIRPRKVEEFACPSDVRDYLVSVFSRHRETLVAGLVTEFSSYTFDATTKFARIGSGSLGGKGRGLAFVNSLINKFKIADHIEGVHIHVPPAAVLATDFFDQFMEESGLTPLVLGECTDEEIATAFLAAKLSSETRQTLRAFLKEVTYPLAVRSSSLLEDSSYQPFAGVYKTYMLPNDNESLDERLEELCKAVKLVYASTYFTEPRAYIESTPNRLEEEKMAIVIQQVVGRRHEDYFYPDIAGTARSYDYYPMKGMKPEDGVANVALGLGKMVVEGGRVVRFSPEHPQNLYQFSTIDDFLEHAQREFFALDMSGTGPRWDKLDMCETNLVQLGLDAAEKHGTLNAVGSVYSSENDAVYDGVSRPGVRLVTMCGLLKADVFPLAKVLGFILKVGAAGFSCPVEIEFAVNLHPSGEGPHEFGFLQIRPLVITSEAHNLKTHEIEPSEAVCISNNALGNGFIDGIRDILLVRRDTFRLDRTVSIAQEIEKLNTGLKGCHRPYLLIGPGRWGTTDQYAGVPVKWHQISCVRCIIETDIAGVSMPPSQGTHFFHNITSLGIGYLTVSSARKDGFIDLDWLQGQDVVTEMDYIRHISLDKPLEILLDGRNRQGVVMKPGFGITR